MITKSWLYQFLCLVRTGGCQRTSHFWTERKAPGSARKHSKRKSWHVSLILANDNIQWACTSLNNTRHTCPTSFEQWTVRQMSTSRIFESDTERYTCELLITRGTTVVANTMHAGEQWCWLLISFKNATLYCSMGCRAFTYSSLISTPGLWQNFRFSSEQCVWDLNRGLCQATAHSVAL